MSTVIDMRHFNSGHCRPSTTPHSARNHVICHNATYMSRPWWWWPSM